MHWFIWAVLGCLIFLATYNPRTGNLNKFLRDADNDQSFSDNQVSVEDGASSAPRVRTPREA